MMKSCRKCDKLHNNYEASVLKKKWTCYKKITIKFHCNADKHCRLEIAMLLAQWGYDVDSNVVASTHLLKDHLSLDLTFLEHVFANNNSRQ